MKGPQLVAVVILGGGAIYVLTRPGLVPLLQGQVVDPYDPTNSLTPGQEAALANIRNTAPGNALVVPNAPSTAVALAGALDSAIAAGAGLLLSTVVSGAALGAATAGVGLAIAFFTYEWLKQRASIATNRARDAWTNQFIALHDALGIRKLTAAQTAGSGPGDIEMGEVIFYFDHDPTQRLWNAVTHTQNEAQFTAAAKAVEAFLVARGVPVTGI